MMYRKKYDCRNEAFRGLISKNYFILMEVIFKKLLKIPVCLYFAKVCISKDISISLILATKIP